MKSKKIFLYGELQMTVPFSDVDWQSINAQLKKVPGLVRKTWLYGIHGGSVGDSTNLTPRNTLGNSPSDPMPRKLQAWGRA